MAGKRQRGVKASRIKLEQFMATAGIKSQAELARKIADIEGLDTEPKDLVNRIFRQNKVEHQSLERLAHALGVDAYKLYLTQDDQALLSDNQKASATANTNSNVAAEHIATTANTTILANTKQTNNTVFNGLLIASLVTLIVVIMWWTLPSINSSQQSQKPPNVSLKEPASFLIYPKSKSLYPLARYISSPQNSPRDDKLRFGLVPEPLFESFELNSQALTKYEVDNILMLEAAEFDRYISVFIKQYTNEHSSDQTSENADIIAVFNLSKNELAGAYNYVADQVYQMLLADTKALADYSNEQIKQTAADTMQARSLAEQYYDSDNMKQAMALLNSLPKQSEESLAIQCFIKVNIGWHSNEKENLEQAQHLCERALVLNSQHPLVRSTNAFRLFRSGELKLAAREYNALLEQYPKNVDALLGQAQLSMQYYMQSPAERVESLEHAISLSQQAILHEPSFWKSYHLLSQFFYLAKQPKQALAVLKELNGLVDNQMVLANVTMLSLCQSELENTHTYAKQMLAINPDAYIAHETLFFIHAYQHQPQQALAAMKKAMAHFSEQGGLFMQWGQLADAYRWSGDKTQAVEHYQTALVEYQQDKTKNQTTDIDIVYSVYFQAAIHQLNNSKIPQSLVKQLESLDIESMPSSYQLKAAVIHKWLGNLAKTNSIKQNLITTCPVYAHATDLTSSNNL